MFTFRLIMVYVRLPWLPFEITRGNHSTLRKSRVYCNGIEDGVKRGGRVRLQVVFRWNWQEKRAGVLPRHL